MKKYLRLMPLLVLLAALLCGCGKKGQTAPAEPDEPEPTVIVEETTSVFCSDGSKTLRFRRDDDGKWLWIDDVSFPLNGEYVAELIAAAQELEALAPLPQADGPEACGLIGAKSYLRLTRSDGSEVTYYLGNSTDGGYYCNSTGNEQQIRVAPERIMALLGRNIYDMALLPQFPDLSAGQIRSAAITRNDATDHLAVSRGKWSRGGQDVSGEEQVSKLAAGLETLAVLKCVDYAPAAGAAEVCGLEPPAAILVLELDKTKLTLRIGGYDPSGEGYFVTIDDDTTIYLMGGEVPALLTNWSTGK